MAQRPIFLASASHDKLVEEVSLILHWHSGFAPIQKHRNIVELHAAAKAKGIGPVLEVSTKSPDLVGQRLSAFNLKTPLGRDCLPIEVAFQGSKVFECDGPFPDLYSVEPRIARRDERLRESGKLVGFRFGDMSFAVKPVTAFYDWLYLRAIYPHRDWLERLNIYGAFSDIEFNPEKSVNCQARSCALFFSLRNKGLLEAAMANPESFVKILCEFDYMSELPKPHEWSRPADRQSTLTLR